MDLLSRNILFVFVCLPMGPIPTDREKCHEGTKGGGRWRGNSRDGGIVVVLPGPLENNPSVSLTADSSLYTREPKELPAFGAAAPIPSACLSSVSAGGYDGAPVGDAVLSVPRYPAHRRIGPMGTSAPTVRCCGGPFNPPAPGGRSARGSRGRRYRGRHPGWRPGGCCGPSGR